MPSSAFPFTFAPDFATQVLKKGYSTAYDDVGSPDHSLRRPPGPRGRKKNGWDVERQRQAKIAKATATFNTEDLTYLEAKSVKGKTAIP